MKRTSKVTRRRERRSWTLLSFLLLTGAVLSLLGTSEDIVGAQEQPKKKAEAAARKAALATPQTPAPVASVPGKAVDVTALAGLIDREIQRRLDAEGAKPAARGDDAEFLRRVYLDLVGVIPPPEKVKAFLDSTDPKKRAAVIDELLADPRFGTALAETWTGLLIPRESNNRRLASESLEKWLADNFNGNKPLDQLVSDLLTATGSQDENGAVTFFIANPTVDKMTDTVSRMFLGVQLQCAQCHNHPFTDYKQTDYWGMAGFFMKTRMQGNPNQAAKTGTAPSIREVNSPPKKLQALPESAKKVPPKFLHGAQPKLEPSEPYRPALARWLTTADNPFFAKAMTNRVWYHLFGRGLVSPVDDMHDDNAASHPELLAALTDQFKASGFDLKSLVRAICNSETYQRSSRSATDAAAVDPDLYSQRALRVLTPAQLYDSLTAVVGRQPRGPAAAQQKKGPVGPREQFISFFHVEEANPLDYQTGIPQALRLMNSALSNGNGPTVAALTKDAAGPAEAVERLYLAVLSRRPTPDETQRLTAYVARQADARTAYGDILWAVLNSSEFVLNH